MKKVNQFEQIAQGSQTVEPKGDNIPKYTTIEAPRTTKKKQIPKKGDIGYDRRRMTVSKLLGVNQGLASLGAVLGYLALGVGVGLYTGTSSISKVRRAIIFGVTFPISANIIGGVGDKIVSKVRYYKTQVNV